jgi:hypothetical protein
MDEAQMKSSFVIALSVFLGACAGYGGSRLLPGQSDMAEIIGVMGEPRMQWANSDGSRRLAYPRGPMGVHTFMVDVGADGKLQRIENAMTLEVFSRIQAGMNKDQVLRILGPSVPAWTMYFKARDELVWDWRYCDDWNQLARFSVLFDGTTGAVRSTLTLREDQIGDCGPGRGCWCSR